MAKRLDLHALLVSILGSSNVYFQPPSNLVMQYPCIVYARANEDQRYANGLPYSRQKQYSITVIDKDPDSLTPDKVGGLPMSSFSRHFKADNLNHDVFNLYF